MQQCQVVMQGLLNGGPNAVCSESHILELFVGNQTMNDSQVLDAINNPDAKSFITGMIDNFMHPLTLVS